jgi:hypothetical protein
MINIVGVALILLGGWSLAVSLFQWNWYANSRHGRAMVALFGRKVARIVDITVGLTVLLLGIAITFEGVL